MVNQKIILLDRCAVIDVHCICRPKNIYINAKGDIINLKHISKFNEKEYGRFKDLIALDISSNIVSPMLSLFEGSWKEDILNISTLDKENHDWLKASKCFFELAGVDTFFVNLFKQPTYKEEVEGFLKSFYKCANTIFHYHTQDPHVPFPDVKQRGIGNIDQEKLSEVDFSYVINLICHVKIEMSKGNVPIRGFFYLFSFIFSICGYFTYQNEKGQVCNTWGSIFKIWKKNGEPLKKAKGSSNSLEHYFYNSFFDLFNVFFSSYLKGILSFFRHDSKLQGLEMGKLFTQDKALQHLIDTDLTDIYEFIPIENGKMDIRPQWGLIERNDKCLGKLSCKQKKVVLRKMKELSNYS